MGNIYRHVKSMLANTIARENSSNYVKSPHTQKLKEMKNQINSKTGNGYARDYHNKTALYLTIRRARNSK